MALWRKEKRFSSLCLMGMATLSPMHSPDLVWGWEPAAIRKTKLDRVSAFVIKHANWPAEVASSSCQTSELEGGLSPLTEGTYTVECPNANFTPAKVVLKRYVDNKPQKSTHGGGS